jgi:hypothetical protein
MYRKSVVAGSFYPASTQALQNFIEKYKQNEKYAARIIIAPHAGYIFSGPTAVKTITTSKISKNVILLGPNHTGLGEKLSVYPTGSWQTPFGDVFINSDIVDNITGELFKKDTLAHMGEHSLEVMLPILKYIKSDVKIVPITISHLSKIECKRAAEKLNEIAKKYDITILISTDLNHFEDEETTRVKDSLAIEKILEIDPDGLYDTVFEKDISMCGVFPVTIGLYLARLLNLNNAKLIEHTTSAKTSADFRRVVGYAGILIW